MAAVARPSISTLSARIARFGGKAPHREHILSARQGRACAAMGGGGAHIAVLGSKDAHELKELSKLPDAANVVAIGSADEILGEGDDRLRGVDTVLVTSAVPGSAKDALRALWPKLPGLSWVHSTSAGVTNILFDELTKSDVVLTNAKGAFSHSLAEYAMAACMHFAKRIPELQANQRAHKWQKLHVEELRGRRLGVIGYGDIGQTTAKLAIAFGMNIAALRRRTELSKEEAGQGLQVYPPDRLEELTGSCDYLVTALPATPATEKFVSASAIRAMQPHAVFINLGRGTTVDEDALTEALEQRRIRGAALDVFREEPLPESSPLWGLENLLLSPHCADMTTTFQHEAVEQFTGLVKDRLAGRPLSNVCDKGAGY